jgi:GT2 family glycosyltransferase
MPRHAEPDCLRELAVVVPIGPREDAWRRLLPELCTLPPAARVVLVAASPDDLPRSHDPACAALGAEVVALTAERGRASQQNAGARAAARRFLWFLHADSRLAPTTVPALARSLARRPEALGFFDLRFLDDGPAAVRLNAFGVRIRSRWLGLPFGDQGFFLSEASFARLGGFDPTLVYGEDHALVWAARRAGVPLVSAPSEIYTSARKYAERGWLRTTARHVRLTAAQAWREARRGSTP